MRRVHCNPLWPSTNQKIQNQIDDENYARHRRRIQTAKPAIDNKAPTSYSHLITKLKKIQIEAERHAKIMQDNMLLLKRMSDILHSKGPLGYYQQEARPKTRSGIKSHQRNEDNDEFITKWEEDWEKKVNLLTQLTESAKQKRDLHNSNLCPRYIKDFGDQSQDRKGFLPNIRRVSTGISWKQIEPINSEAESMKKKSRPKAATGQRLKKKNVTKMTSFEEPMTVILSDQFQKDLPLQFFKK